MRTLQHLRFILYMGVGGWSECRFIHDTACLQRSCDRFPQVSCLSKIYEFKDRIQIVRLISKYFFTHWVFSPGKGKNIKNRTLVAQEITINNWKMGPYDVWKLLWIKGLINLKKKNSLNSGTLPEWIRLLSDTTDLSIKSQYLI